MYMHGYLRQKHLYHKISTITKVKTKIQKVCALAKITNHKFNKGRMKKCWNPGECLDAMEKLQVILIRKQKSSTRTLPSKFYTRRAIFC